MTPKSDPLSSAVLAYLMEAAPVIAVRLDEEGAVVDANAHARRVLGEGIVGQPLSHFVVHFGGSPETTSRDLAAPGTRLLNVLTATGLPETLTCRFVPLPGGPLLLGAPDALEQERLQREVLGLNRELSTTTRQLHQTNAELRELSQLKNLFLGMAAHDLRKPVGLVMTYAGLILEGGDGALSAEHAGYLRVCLNAATTMLEAIDTFLDVAAIESGRLRLDPAPVSVSEMLSSVVEMVRFAADKQRVSLVVDVADEARTVRADGPRLRQMLLNLLSNAVEHSEPGQRVWLTAGWEDGHLVLGVRDEGPGLTPEEQRRLFAPFERGAGRGSALERHLALGLTIAHKVVEAHRGRIWIESAPGQGATFRVALPADPDSEDDADADSSARGR